MSSQPSELEPQGERVLWQRLKAAETRFKVEVDRFIAANERARAAVADAEQCAREMGKARHLLVNVRSRWNRLTGNKQQPTCSQCGRTPSDSRGTLRVDLDGSYVCRRPCGPWPVLRRPSNPGDN